MTIERGFRRILVVVSTVLLGAGLVCLVALAAASAWSFHLDRQMTARIAAEGCPTEIAKRGGYAYEGGIRGSPVVTRLSQSRWRVAIPKRGSTYFYVVNTRRGLTDAQMIEFAETRFGSKDLMAPRWEALPRVDIVDCLWATHEIGEQNRMATSSRFIDWWMERPFVWVVVWPAAIFTALDVTLVAAIIASPAILAAALTALA